MQAQVRTSDRLIIQMGSSLGARDSCVIEEMSDTVAGLVLAELAAANAGVTLSGDHETIARLPPGDLPENVGATLPERVAALELAVAELQKFHEPVEPPNLG